MSGWNRRRFIAHTGAAGVTMSYLPWRRARAGGARVVVVGGGFGGATCARYLHMLERSLEVVLVERDVRYVTCPFSNLVLGGVLDIDALSIGYARLEAGGVRLIHDSVDGIDVERRRVHLGGGDTLDYDRLVVAPGIELRFDAVPGYDRDAAELLPHAWQAGAQTLALRARLVAMADGGLVVIAVPAEPYRCPPGPYERASLIAHYLIRHKPKSKVLILDAKDGFSKQGLFRQAWAERYPGMIEWVPGSQGGIVEAVDARRGALVTESGFTEQRGDVINFIPPQRAAAIARRAGLVDDSGWCPVDQHSFASTLAPDVHVIGDAAVAGAMPKSAFSANSQAKVCAAAVVASLRGETLPMPSYANTCYSLVAPDYGISVSAVYRLNAGRVITAVEGAGGVSPAEVGTDFRAKEADYARGWYAAITADSWG